MSTHVEESQKIFVVESIRTQTDDFGKRLEGLFELLEKGLKSKEIKAADLKKDHPLVTRVQDCIFERLGIRTKIITDEGLAAIYPFYSNRNHIFLDSVFRGRLNLRDQTKLLEQFNGRKGSVNIEKAKVSGFFSEYVHPLYLNFPSLFLLQKLTAAEVAAVTLHELGHAFSACYYSDRIDRTNQVLSGIAKNVLGAESGDLEYVYKELSKVSKDITKETVDAILNGPRVVAGVKWFKVASEIVRSQTMDDTYNKTSFEQLSDQFASRFGYGKELVTGLDKISSLSKEKNLFFFIWFQIGQMYDLFTLVTLIAAAIGTGGVVQILVMLMVTSITLFLERSDIKDYTYDELKERYLRIRKDTIDQLKDQKLDKNFVKSMLETIYRIDEAIKATRNVKSLKGLVADFVFPKGRSAKDSIYEQRLMETLASNDLFIASAELRV